MNPDPDGLLSNGSDQKLDFGLKPRISEVDRDADGSYRFVSYEVEGVVAKCEGSSGVPRYKSATASRTMTGRPAATTSRYRRTSKQLSKACFGA